MSKHIIVNIILICLVLSACGNVAEIPVPTPVPDTVSSEIKTTDDTVYECEATPVPFLDEPVFSENFDFETTSPYSPALSAENSEISSPDAEDINNSWPDEHDTVDGFSEAETGTGQSKAGYLFHESYSTRNDSEQLSYFIRALKSGVKTEGRISDDAASTAEGIESLIYLVPDGFHYIRLCASVAGLTDTGTFEDTEDAEEQYLYLTGANKFKSVPLNQCKCFGGSGNLKTGDVLFWFDDSGKAVSSGLVVAVSEEYIKVVIQGWGDTVALLEINDTNISGLCLEKGMTVSIEYPGVEYRIFAFLTEKMNYSAAAACGVMANLFKESGFIAATGKSTYGLCQWQGDRLTAMLNFCYGNKLESSTLDAQLKFLRHELTEGDFQELNTFLLSLGNSEDDAFNSAKQFCIQYEKPGNAYAMGNDRGDLAKQIYKLYS